VETRGQKDMNMKRGLLGILPYEEEKKDRKRNSNRR
jgi:hypothetical protein